MAALAKTWPDCLGRERSYVRVWSSYVHARLAGWRYGQREGDHEIHRSQPGRQDRRGRVSLANSPGWSVNSPVTQCEFPVPQHQHRVLHAASTLGVAMRTLGVVM
eukprot:2530914-Pyramimonas_sp.AAC.1